MAKLVTAILAVTVEPEMVWFGVGVIKETRGTSRARARFMDLLCRVTAITVKGYERLCSVKFYV